MKLALTTVCLILTTIIAYAYGSCPAVNEYNAQWKVTSPGGGTTGTCNTDYVGTPQRICLANSTWAYPLKLCYPSTNTCTGQTFANAVWNDTLIGYTANGTCVTGYSGNPTRKCNFDSTWSASISPSCSQIRCANVTEGNATWPQTIAGALVVGTCVSGFGGRETRYCLSNGTFGPITGTCLQCLGEFYGTATYPTAAAQTYSYGVCMTGYKGTPRRFCTPEGIFQTYIWDPCQIIKCYNKTEDNAFWPNVDFNGYSYGTCQSGYIGTPYRQCILNGTSAYLGPISNPCLSNDTVCWNKTYGNAVWDNTPPGVTATGTCIPGYFGTPTMKCSATAQWSTSITNQCQRLTCAEEIIGNTRFIKTNSNSTAVGQCLNGTSGRVFRTCDITGTWGTPTAACA